MGVCSAGVIAVELLCDGEVVGEEHTILRSCTSVYISILFLVYTGSFSRLSTPSFIKPINRDKHKCPLSVGMVFLLVPNSEYTMKLQVIGKKVVG